MLTGACFNPIFGRIYQLYSTKWVFLVAIAIFEAGSALCGAAPNSIAFIVGRAIAGIGSAFIFSGGSMVILPLVRLQSLFEESLKDPWRAYVTDVMHHTHST